MWTDKLLKDTAIEAMGWAVYSLILAILVRPFAGDILVQKTVLAQLGEAWSLIFIGWLSCHSSSVGIGWLAGLTMSKVWDRPRDKVMAIIFVYHGLGGIARGSADDFDYVYGECIVSGKPVPTFTLRVIDFLRSKLTRKA